MSQLNRLIDTIIRDRMLTCQCTNDGQVCTRWQYEALKEPEPKPSYERVPEGVFIKDGCRLSYMFGNNQILAWDAIYSCYSVCSSNFLCTRYSRSPYLIPATFGELAPGEWFRFQLYYKLKIDDKRMAVGLSDGTVSIGSLWDGCSISRVSEVMP